MAERALYDGDQVTLFWGGMAHRCRVYEPSTLWDVRRADSPP